MSNKPVEMTEGRHHEVSAVRLRVVVLMAFVIAGFALFWPTTQSLIVRWEDSVHRTYTHGFLIVGLSLWLLWRSRERWMVASQPNLQIGVPLILLLAFAWLIAVRAGLQIVHQALLPLIIFAAVFTCFGKRLLRRAWLPLAYLYFAIPVWDALNSLLQWISVFAVRFLLRLIGIPAFFENNTFQIPAGVFEIAGGCSGLHFFIVGLAIAVLYGEVHRDGTKVRIKLIMFAAVLAMATNWIRIVIIVIAGHMTQMRHYLVSGEHYTFGWFMFAGAMLIFFLVVRRWPAAPEVDVVDAPETGRAVDRVGVISAVLALVVVPLLLAADYNRANASALARVPDRIAGWSRSDQAVVDWQPQFEGADARQIARFERSGDAVDVFVAAYASQAQGKEVVGYGNSLTGSTLRPATRARPEDGGWTAFEALDYAGQRWLIGHVYTIDGELLARPLELQLRYALRSFVTAPATAVIAVRTRCADTCESARAVLHDFIDAQS